jgi:hypothetical protein
VGEKKKGGGKEDTWGAKKDKWEIEKKIQIIQIRMKNSKRGNLNRKKVKRK